jgi:hypothetical protein
MKFLKRESSSKFPLHLRNNFACRLWHNFDIHNPADLFSKHRITDSLVDEFINDMIDGELLSEIKFADACMQPSSGEVFAVGETHFILTKWDRSMLFVRPSDTDRYWYQRDTHVYLSNFTHKRLQYLVEMKERKEKEIKELAKISKILEGLEIKP